MCGITGWISFDRDLTTEQDTLAAMTRTMECRGPDSCGTHVEPRALLGHRRLAVIDLVGGQQPMSVTEEAGTVSLVFSGEIYNFKELRAELTARGERFRTASDTEVVLRGYLRWGDQVCERLNGMFAFAVWDGRTSRLVLVRDRIGVKPLFLARTPDGVVFGSEQKAVLANPAVRRVVDTAGLREWLAFVMTPGHAIWRGIEQVEPGTVVTVDSRGVRERTYWRLEARPHTDSLDDTVSGVREILQDTVTRQLVADVPQCVLLSGGLDSSALTALSAAALGDRPVRTFSVDFVGRSDTFRPDDLRSTPDAPYVRAVTEHVRTDHADIVLDSAALADPAVRRAALIARDVPVGFGEMDFSLYLLFQAIRERSTVALSGEVADELFAGYRQFHDPEIVDAPEFGWIAVNAGPLDKDGTGLRADLLKRLDLDGYRRDSYASAAASVPRLGGDSDAEHRMRVMSHLHLTRFVRFLLERKDRLSMAVGLEVRVPFGDHRLIEYVYNAPWAMKSHDGREKSLLRAAVRTLLPEAVLDRPKAAYPSTQDPSYAIALQRQASRLLGDPGHGVFALVDQLWLADVVRRDAAGVDKLTRLGLERTLDLAIWIDEYRPTLDVDAD
ncbi:asparagine synthase (glutamine-hydrolyzing) [Actinoplanes sp. NPDC051346]|uniref:asparagine synthase (glutamine-hydrolyzing) n=1 Tax=Actinoplanes sp. NPDC051346 TaxID=3155048 RepID=UPI003427EB17